METVGKEDMNHKIEMIRFLLLTIIMLTASIVVYPVSQICFTIGIFVAGMSFCISLIEYKRIH